MADTIPPRWHPRPTCPGRWLVYNGHDYRFYDLPEVRGDEEGWYYGPIPTIPRVPDFKLHHVYSMTTTTGDRP